MCPFEEWLGFCPFAALRSLWGKLTRQTIEEVWVSVQWGPRP